MKPLPCLYHVSTTAIFVEKEQHGGGVQHRISTAARWLTIKYRRCLLSGAAAMAIWSGQWGCRLRCAMSENQVRQARQKQGKARNTSLTCLRYDPSIGFSTDLVAFHIDQRSYM